MFAFCVSSIILNNHLNLMDWNGLLALCGALEMEKIDKEKNNLSGLLRFTRMMVDCSVWRMGFFLKNNVSAIEIHNRLQKRKILLVELIHSAK